jgi:hypothetical protein
VVFIHSLVIGAHRLLWGLEGGQTGGIGERGDSGEPGGIGESGDSIQGGQREEFSEKIVIARSCSILVVFIVDDGWGIVRGVLGGCQGECRESVREDGKMTLTLFLTLLCFWGLVTCSRKILEKILFTLR